MPGNFDQINLNIGKYTFESFQVHIGASVVKIMLDDGVFNEDINWYYSKHNHPVYEVHYCIKGQDVLEIDNEQVELLPDTFCIISPGIYHIQHKTNDSFRKRSFKFEIEHIKSHEKHMNYSDYQVGSILGLAKFIHLIDRYNTRDLFDNAFEEIKTRDDFYNIKIQCIFTEILINLLRSIQTVKNESGKDASAISYENKTSIIDTFFDRNYNNPNATNETLAKTLNVSVRQMSRIISKYYQCSFKDKIQETRIERAKYLLVNSEHSIQDISEMVGFSSPEYFYNNFKRFTLMTPGEYKKINRENKAIPTKIIS